MSTELTTREQMQLHRPRYSTRHSIIRPQIERLLFACLVLALSTGQAQATESRSMRPKASTMAHACAGCHGTFGRASAGTPVLAGMSESDFVRAMRAFKSGQRNSSIMNRIAKGYQDEDFVALARFFKAQ